MSKYHEIVVIKVLRNYSNVNVLNLWW